MAKLLKKSTPDSCITKAMRWEKICMTSVQYSHLQYSPDITPVLVNLLYRSSCQKMFYAATKGAIKNVSITTTSFKTKNTYTSLNRHDLNVH